MPASTFPLPALAALAAVLEAAFGYPQNLYRAIKHPVVWIGALIAFFDRRLNREDQSSARRRFLGAVALALILAATLLTAQGVGFALERLPPVLGVIVTALIASSLIAQRSLDAHVRAVVEALDRAGIEGGRKAVAAIVGRDVRFLDEAGVTRAAIESLAENSSDGVVAPLFWIALCGLGGGAAYKAINTADSMIGHRNKRYEAFGFAAAKIDDLANFFPARLSVAWVAIAALLLEGASASDALRAAMRDARGHPSPDAGWPEAAFAGALGLRLGGPRSYDGKIIEDEFINARGADPARSDMLRALALYRRVCFVNTCALMLASLLVWTVC